VSVTAALQQSSVVIDVDDDGTGLHPAMRDLVIRRGVRADEAAPGSGLGLAIVRELAEAYDGAVALDQSPSGGMRARLTLPMGTYAQN
jgi:signal transduction histidine kinase